MTPPVITAFYAALAALFFIWLTARVVRGRRGTGTSIGDGGHESLVRSIRAHGNAAEQMPLFLVLLALAELTGFAPVALHIFGLAFLAGRLMHGLRFNGIGPTQFRVLGMVLTLLATTSLALAILASLALGLS